MLNSYVQNIMIFIILTVLIEVVLPSEQYSKYIRLVIGFVLMFNIIIPVQRIITYVDRESVTISYDDIGSNLIEYNNDDIEKQYRNYVENNLNSQLALLVSSSTDYMLIDCNMDIETIKNNYVINSISMQLKLGDENNSEGEVYIRPIEKIQLNVNNSVNENVQDIVENTEIKELKNNISLAYNVDISNIHINILKDEEVSN